MDSTEYIFVIVKYKNCGEKAQLSSYRRTTIVPSRTATQYFASLKYPRSHGSDYNNRTRATYRSTGKRFIELNAADVCQMKTKVIWCYLMREEELEEVERRNWGTDIWWWESQSLINI